MMQQSQKPLGRPKKETQQKSTKEIILQVATDMFLDKGYPLISMDDVAQQCDVTKATVYYYYKTKADLFTDAMIQLMYRITQSIVKIFSTDISLKEQLFTLAKEHLQATINIDINTFMKEAKHSLSKQQEEQMKEAESKLYQALEDGLQKSMDEGVIPQSNTHLAAFIFISMLSVGKENEKTFDSLDDLVTEIVDFYWNGLANKA